MARSSRGSERGPDVGGWLPYDKLLPSKPEIAILARALGGLAHRHAAVGLMLSFWAWVDDVGGDVPVGVAWRCMGRCMALPETSHGVAGDAADSVYIHGITVEDLVHLVPGGNDAFWEAAASDNVGWVLTAHRVTQGVACNASATLDEPVGIVVPRFKRWVKTTAKLRRSDAHVSASTLRSRRRRDAARAAADVSATPIEPSATLDATLQATPIEVQGGDNATPKSAPLRSSLERDPTRVRVQSGAVAPSASQATPDDATVAHATHDDDAKKPKPVKKATASTSHLAPFAAVWLSRYGGHMAFGEAAKALKPLLDSHGAAAVLVAWTNYCDETDGQYASPTRFAATYGRWVAGAVRANNPAKSPSAGGDPYAAARAMAEQQEAK